MNELQVGGSPNRDLARLAMSPAWDRDKAISEFGALDVAATTQEIERSLTPLKSIEPGCVGEMSTKINQSLAMIGMKVRPEMPADQCRGWVNAVMVALSDLPPAILVRSAADAMHTCFEFLTNVEAKVREIAEARVETNRHALRRLHAMRAEIDRAMSAQPRLEDANEGALSTAEVHEMQRKGLKEVIRIGLEIGSITEDQLMPPEEMDEGENNAK